MSAVALPISSELIADAIHDAGITHVVTVPDTHQRTLLSRLEADRRRLTVRAGTEADVLGICAGLWMAGTRPMALVQQLGLFASANALRWTRHEAQIPLTILAGLYARNTELAVDDDPRSSVSLCGPMLDALQIPWSLVEGPQDEGAVAAALHATAAEHRMHVVLLGAPTS